REWRKHHSKKEPKYIIAKTKLLEKIAYNFFKNDQEVFSRFDLREEVQSYLQTESDFNDIKAADLVQELTEEDGIIQKLTRKQKAMETTEDERFVFLHRTFQEYLTASYLCRVIEKQPSDCIAIVKEKFWNYNWHETLSLLAGLMKEPILLIKNLMNEDDDIFNDLLLLAGQCIAECKEISSENSDPLITSIINKLYEFWHSYPSIDFIKVNITTLCQSNFQMLSKLRRAIKDKDRNVRQHATEILGQVASKWVVKQLIQACEEKDPIVRDKALWALEKICCFEGGKQELISHLRNQETNILRGAVWASGKIGLTMAVKPLINLLFKEKDSKNRQQAAEALGRIGSIEAVEPLNKVLLEENEFIYLKRAVAKALGQIGNSKAVPPLCKAFYKNNDIYFRRRVIWSLGQIGNSKAIPTLAQILRKSPDRSVKHLAVDALERIDHPQASRCLLYALKNDEDKYIKKHAIKALAEIGDSNRWLVMSLIQLLDESSGLMKEAAFALMQIGGYEGLEILKEKLDHTHDIGYWSYLNGGDVLKYTQNISLFFDVNFDDIINILNEINYDDINSRISNISGQDLIFEEFAKLEYELLNNEAFEDRIMAAKYFPYFHSLGCFEKSKSVYSLIISLFQDSDSRVRRQDIKSLGEIGNTETLTSIIQALLKDTSSNVRREAADAIGKLYKSCGVEISESIKTPLIQSFLKEKDTNVKKSILNTLLIKRNCDKGNENKNIVNQNIINLFSNSLDNVCLDKQAEYQFLFDRIDNFLEEYTSKKGNIKEEEKPVELEKRKRKNQNIRKYAKKLRESLSSHT
ncbi:MAG: HEAT repeat domain-containing protein, partial [Xenococcus sp. (in: cyanobacteria)]